MGGLTCLVAVVFSLVISVSCRTSIVKMNDDGHLMAMVSEDFVMRLAEADSIDIDKEGYYGFEMCLLNSKKVLVESSCVNTIRISSSIEGYSDEPLVLELYELDESKLTPEVQRDLTRQQEEIQRFEEVRDAEVNPAKGTFAILRAARNLISRRAKRAIHGVRQFPLKYRIPGIVAVFASGSAFLELSSGKRAKNLRAQDKQHSFREVIATERGEDDDFAVQSDQWLLMMENYNDVLSNYGVDDIEVTSMEQYARVFATYLREIGLVPWQRGVEITAICFPLVQEKLASNRFVKYGSGYDSITRYKNRISDCPMFLRPSSYDG